MIRFLFRRPKFPVICDAQGVLIGAGTPRQLTDQLLSIEHPPGGPIRLIDAAAEGWALDIDRMIVSPFIGKKSWTKKEVIELFNKSKTARQVDLEYPARSLSSKRFDRIIDEIVEQIVIANKIFKRTDAKILTIQ